MKKLLFGFAIGTGCTLLLANSHEKSTAAQRTTSDSLINCGSFVKDSVLRSVETAMTWRANYQKHENALSEIAGKSLAPFASAFTLQTSDLLIALGLPLSDTTHINHRHVRGYLGIDETGNSKIFFVGVDGADFATRNAGTDVFFSCASQRTDDPEFVLDLNYPCPTLCPDKPLSKAASSALKKKKK